MGRKYTHHLFLKHLVLQSKILEIPTIISGLTFLAAATSIPDAVSSMAVARKGRLTGGCVG